MLGRFRRWWGDRNTSKAEVMEHLGQVEKAQIEIAADLSDIKKRIDVFSDMIEGMKEAPEGWNRKAGRR